MKFKFCGDNDCQDWLLSQINVCSRLTSIKLKLILKEVIQHILHEKLNLQNVSKLTADAKLNEEETKAILAALNFIILSSIRYETDSEILSNELQQLGLPKEHSIGIAKLYSDNFIELKDKIHDKSLKWNSLLDCSYEIVPELKNETMNIKYPTLLFSLKTSSNIGQIETTKFHITPEKLTCLIKDLKQVEKMLNENEFDI